MIITDLKASNILKYAELDLPDLPQQGVIAIEGANESGKSSIGEMICFALFGRTFSLSEQQLEKLIRWGETHCSVNLCFRIDDGGHFEIARYLDRDGNQGVRLNSVGEGEQPIARGREAVAVELRELLGFSYEEFIESFYLAQREITTPHPHSHAVKAMAGITRLESVSQQYRQEIGEFRHQAEESEGRYQSLAGELQALAIDPDALGGFEAERDSTLTTLEALDLEAAQLEQTSQDYQAGAGEYRTLLGRLGRMKFLRLLLFLIALLLLAGWGMLTYQPDHSLSAQLLSLLQGTVPGWSAARASWLLYAAGGAAFLFLISLVRMGRLRSQQRNLLAVAQALVEKIDGVEPLPAADVQSGGEIAGEPGQEFSMEPQDTDGFSAEGAEGFERAAGFEQADLALLRPRVAAYAADANEVRSAVGEVLNDLRSSMQRLQGRRGELEQQIREEQARLGSADELQRIGADMATKRDDALRRLHLRELGCELLDGAARHQSQRFNHDLRDLVGRTLPLFTEGRYEHLQIDDDLTVRVFSTEKRDFMNLEEISSGTQRQIMLAVRLALSEELANKSVRGRQFLFLDEPFAFFDRKRTESSISVLPDLSEVITQIWVVAQAFPQQQQFDLSLICERELGELTSEG